MALGLDCLSSTPGWLIAELDKILRRQHDAERVQAKTRQALAARHLGTARKSVNGLGRPRLEVDTYAYHYWGKRLGYKCWRDPQFLREFERDNPEARVKAKGTKEIHVGWAGVTEFKPRVARFTKTYS